MLATNAFRSASGSARLRKTAILSSARFGIPGIPHPAPHAPAFGRLRDALLQIIVPSALQGVFVSGVEELFQALQEVGLKGIDPFNLRLRLCSIGPQFGDSRGEFHLFDGDFGGIVSYLVHDHAPEGRGTLGHWGRRPRPRWPSSRLWSATSQATCRWTNPESTISGNRKCAILVNNNPSRYYRYDPMEPRMVSPPDPTRRATNLSQRDYAVF